MLSIVCAYNDEIILKNNLLCTINEQNQVEYELILIDGREYNFASASETLNFAGTKAKGKYIIFVHQDVRLTDKNTLRLIESFCDNYEFGIAGLAGLVKCEDSMITASLIHHGETGTLAASYSNFTTPIEAYCLDECFLIIPKEIFKNYKFRYIGNTWHLYGTDYSLQMQEANKNVLIFPVDILHLSDGRSMNTNYIGSIKKLCMIYAGKREFIYTIYGKWPTKKADLFFKCLYRKIRLKIKGV